MATPECGNVAGEDPSVYVERMASSLWPLYRRTHSLRSPHSRTSIDHELSSERSERTIKEATQKANAMSGATAEFSHSAAAECYGELYPLAPSSHWLT